MVTKGFLHPSWAYLSPWLLKKREAKERKINSPVEGNLLQGGWSLKKHDWQKIDSCQSSPFVLLTHINLFLTVVNQALLLWWHTSIISVSRDFDRIEIEQKFIKKVDISLILDRFWLYFGSQNASKTLRRRFPDRCRGQFWGIKVPNIDFICCDFVLEAIWTDLEPILDRS